MKVTRSSIAILSLLLAACGKETVTVYDVPKEEPPKLAPAETRSAAREITWTAPKEWQEQPATEMRQGSFLVNGEKGIKADISVVGFPGDAGGDIANVNRWRGQLNLQALDDAGLQAAGQKIDVNGEPALLFELNEKSDGSGREMVAAILHRDDKTWFFKMMGEAVIVSAQKNNFLDFLKSARFSAGAAGSAGGENAMMPSTMPPMAQGSMPSSSSMAPVADVPKPDWKIPAGWQEQPAGGMRQGSFAVTEGNAKVDISVVALSGDAGGVLANVNRWRGQLLLAEISESDLAAQSSKVDVAEGTAIVVDMASTKPVPGAKSNSRIIAAIVMHGGATWFVKATGDDALVEKQKPAFLEFVKSFRFPSHG